MAEIFGVITNVLGALDAGLRCFKEIRHVVEDYRHAGGRLQEVHDKFEQFEQRFDLWAKTWKVGIYGPSTDTRQIWGEKGAWLIQKQLVAIMKKCEDFKNGMGRLKSPKVLGILRFEGKMLEKPTINARSIAESRELADLIQQASKAKDKAVFALHKASELAKYIT